MEATTIDRSFAGLTKRREQLITTLRHLDDQQEEEVEHNTDWVDQAAYESRVALLDGLRQDYRAELTRIASALARIDTHEYGTCAACHDTIDPKRLELLPEAEHCCACEGFREGLKQYAA